MKTRLLIILTVALAAACVNQSPANSTAPATTQTAVNQTPATPAMNHNGMNHGAHGELRSARDAADAPFDAQFLDTMIAHHTGAVEMAQMVAGKTENQELNRFAQKIISDQNREIAQMKSWREQWFAGKTSALNMDMPGMKESMAMDMSKLDSARGARFDLAFVEAMTPHHVGAVVMSQDALKRAEHQEIKTLATEIIKSQTAEIEQMRDWQTKWK